MKLILSLLSFTLVAGLIAAVALGEDPIAPKITCTNDIIGGDGNNNKTGTPGNDCFYLFGGNDTAKGLQGHDKIEGDAGADNLFGGCGPNNCSPSDVQDLIYGGQGSDELHGQGGDDFLYAGGGGDALYGENGDDTLAARNSYRGDFVDGGTGYDVCFVDSDESVIRDCEDVRRPPGP